MPRCPSQTIRIVTSVDAASHFQRMKIDDGNITIGRTGYEGTRPVWLHLNAGRAVPNRDAFDGFASRGVDNRHVRTAQGRNERKLSVGRELQPVRAAHIRRQRLLHLLARNVNDGHGSVPRVGYPDFLAVRRNIKTFGTVADADYRLIPITSWWRSIGPLLTREGRLRAFSIMLTVPELTFVVTIRFISGET